MKIRNVIIITSVVATSLAMASVAAEKKTSPKPEAFSINASDLKWGEAPPGMPKGAKLAVLLGDPSKKEQFAIRFMMPNGYKIAPHWHTNDEQLTILSGTFVLHMGDSMDSPAHNLGPGSYHFLPGKMHHAASSKGKVVLEIHGVGPFDIHYLNPADDPSKSSPAKGASK